MTADTLISAIGRQTLQNAAATTAPPIDADVLFSRCMGSVSLALALLDELEASGKQRVAAIVLHATNDQAHAAAEAAHSLKGAAAIIGAEPLREKAAEIEAAGHNSETFFLLDRIHDLRGEMDRCLAYIPLLRTNLQQRSSRAR